MKHAKATKMNAAMKMNFDDEIYRTILESHDGPRHVFKITMYCTTRDQDGMLLKMNQMSNMSLLLQEGNPNTLQIHMVECREPKFTDSGKPFGHTSYIIHNELDTNILLKRDES